jgi:hypothetical protein
MGSSGTKVAHLTVDGFLRKKLPPILRIAEAIGSPPMKRSQSFDLMNSR